MTEAEWLTSTDPGKMIEAVRSRGTDRKFRLFAIAACYLCKPRARKPKRQFEVVVEFADGADVLEQVRKAWGGAPGRSWPERPYEWAREFARDAASGEPGYPSLPELVTLLRDVLGNPFRKVSFSPDWRTDTAVLLARQMYESRDFSAMPILADALQDAGCTNEDILSHCRDSEQVHVRGCWVVDLVLSKS